MGKDNLGKEYIILNALVSNKDYQGICENHK